MSDAVATFAYYTDKVRAIGSKYPLSRQKVGGHYDVTLRLPVIYRKLLHVPWLNRGCRFSLGSPGKNVVPTALS